MQKHKPAKLSEAEWLQRRREYQRRYRERHPDKAKAHDKRSQERRIEKRQTPEGREAYRAWWRAYGKKYAALNPEKAKAKQQRSNRKHGRKRQLKHLYGLTLEQYAALLHEHGNCCAICREPFTAVLKPHVDHDHSSGAVRGLLCRFCNWGLGKFFDNPNRLLLAIGYLAKASHARTA